MENCSKVIIKQFTEYKVTVPSPVIQSQLLLPPQDMEIVTSRILYDL